MPRIGKFLPVLGPIQVSNTVKHPKQGPNTGFRVFASNTGKIFQELSNTVIHPLICGGLKNPIQASCSKFTCILLQILLAGRSTTRVS